MLRQAVRGVRGALRQSPPGRWLERRRQLRAVRAWTPADEAMRTFYAGFVAPGDLVFDVGANAGNRTKVFLKLGARVVAVEPQPECASLLLAAFAGDPRVEIVREALGAEPGSAEMMLSQASTISSMSRGWMDAVRTSGRFAAYRWNRSVQVPVTTMDLLIARCGRPTFVKIDVEGFELEVLKGLSSPVRTLSFEFTPEWSDAAMACLTRLEALGFREFNLSLGESMRLERPEWMDAARVRDRLRGFAGDAHTFGDVYARFGV